MRKESELAINGGKAVHPGKLKRSRVFGEEERQAVWDVMGKDVISRAGRGDMVQQFQQAFADYHRIRFATATTSGTTALHTAVEALQIGPGDEVIVPDLTFISTASVVLQVGAKVVFCDVDPGTFTISTEDLEKKITSRTKAVIVVHLYGMPGDMDQISLITERHGLKLIEDCSQAHGASINGKPVGTFGDLGCFSFYQTKNMSCGEGGMVITDNEELATRCNSLIRHGLIGDELEAYDYDKLGYNYAMTELQAAIGLVQLGKLPTLNQRRSKNDELYRRLLQDLPLRLQTKAVGHAHHCLTGVLPTSLGVRRDWFLQAVRCEGGIINCLYPKTLSQTVLFMDRAETTQNAPQLASTLFTLYTNPNVSRHVVEVCCEAIRKIYLATCGGS